MSNKYINNFIRDDSSIAPEYLTALKLQDKNEHKHLSTKLPRINYKVYLLVNIHFDKPEPKFKPYELIKHIPNYRKFKVDRFKEIHNVYNPQNELRGLPDLKIKPEKQTIFQELGTKGMTEKI